MGTHRITRGRTLLGVLVVALSATLAGGALAAHPKAGGHYRGFLAQGAYNEFKPPVSFTVSSDGKRMLRFTYSIGDCSGLGGPGNPWLNPVFARKVGTIKVLSNGYFAVKDAASQTTSPDSEPPEIKYSWSTVTGHFTTARKAVGTIRLKVRNGSKTCPTIQTFSFAATTR